MTNSVERACTSKARSGYRLKPGEGTSERGLSFVMVFGGLSAAGTIHPVDAGLVPARGFQVVSQGYRARHQRLLLNTTDQQVCRSVAPQVAWLRRACRTARKKTVSCSCLVYSDALGVSGIVLHVKRFECQERARLHWESRMRRVTMVWGVALRSRVPRGRRVSILCSWT